MQKSESMTQGQPERAFLSSGTLDEFVCVKLAGYYKGNAEPEIRKRLEGAMSWYNSNRQVILDWFDSDVKTGRLSCNTNSQVEVAMTIGVWLGGRYVASRYRKSDNQTFPVIAVENTSETGGRVVDGKLLLGLSKPRMALIEKWGVQQDEAFVLGFNLGIHEHTHLLPAINGNPNRSLSEIATACTQTTLGLPVRNSPLQESRDLSVLESIELDRVKNDRIRFGARDFLHVYSQLKEGKVGGEALYSIETDYFAFLAAPWIKGFYGGEVDIFQFSKKGYGKIYEANFSETVAGGQGYREFCRSAGITDKNLINKFGEAWKRMPFGEWRDMHKNKGEMFDEFVGVMNSVFGNPKEENIPDYFTARLMENRKRMG